MPSEGRTLARRNDSKSWWGNPIEWAGFYLLGVGVYGAAFRPLTRHLALWGVVPLDWVYLSLLTVGAGLLLSYSPNSPFSLARAPGPKGKRTQLLLLLRGVISLGLLATLVILVALR